MRAFPATHEEVRVSVKLLLLCISIPVCHSTAAGDSLTIEVSADGTVRGVQEQELHKLQLHPNYPQLPLSLAHRYRYGSPINIDYPGLQLVHVSPTSGAPLFIVNRFLNATECEIMIAKLAGERFSSVAYDPNDPGVDKQTLRTSSHVRVTKAETPGFHARVASLTGRQVANMESASPAPELATVLLFAVRTLCDAMTKAHTPRFVYL